jgi:hypothetical protein
LDKFIKVAMTEDEITHATSIGCRRQVQGMIRQTESGGKWGNGKWGADNNNDGFHYNCIGALGEAVLAKFLDVPWDGAIGNFKAKDVGDEYQVRSTLLPYGSLILHDSDKDDDISVLVLLHEIPGFVLAGWIHGHEGKDKKHWKDHGNSRPAYFIKQIHLNPMDTLPRKGK